MNYGQDWIFKTEKEYQHSNEKQDHCIDLSSLNAATTITCFSGKILLSQASSIFSIEYILLSE